LKMLRWTAVLLLLVIGMIDLYYGNSYAGFFENLWYVMGAIYIFAAIIIAADIESHFTQLLIFSYSLFLLALWATTAFETGTGLDAVAYTDKAIEVVLVINMLFLFRSTRLSKTI